MNLKDFFRPTKKKILIYVILLILGFLFAFFLMPYICAGALPGDKPRIIPNFCGHEWMGVVYAILWWPMIIANLTVTETPGWPLIDYIYLVPFLLLEYIIYPYFIACLISQIKIKSSKQN
jgi:hypothetical protein